MLFLLVAGDGICGDVEEAVGAEGYEPGCWRRQRVSQHSALAKGKTQLCLYLICSTILVVHTHVQAMTGNRNISSVPSSACTSECMAWSLSLVIRFVLAVRRPIKCPSKSDGLVDPFFCAELNKSCQQASCRLWIRLGLWSTSMASRMVG